MYVCMYVCTCIFQAATKTLASLYASPGNETQVLLLHSMYNNTGWQHKLLQTHVAFCRSPCVFTYIRSTELCSLHMYVVEQHHFLCIHYSYTPYIRISTTERDPTESCNASAWEGQQPLFPVIVPLFKSHNTPVYCSKIASRLILPYVGTRGVMDVLTRHAAADTGAHPLSHVKP